MKKESTTAATSWTDSTNATENIKSPGGSSYVLLFFLNTEGSLSPWHS